MLFNDYYSQNYAIIMYQGLLATGPIIINYSLIQFYLQWVAYNSDTTVVASLSTIVHDWHLGCLASPLQTEMQHSNSKALYVQNYHSYIYSNAHHSFEDWKYNILVIKIIIICIIIIYNN